MAANNNVTGSYCLSK